MSSSHSLCLLNWATAHDLDLNCEQGWQQEYTDSVCACMTMRTVCMQGVTRSRARTYIPIHVRFISKLSDRGQVFTWRLCKLQVDLATFDGVGVWAGGSSGLQVLLGAEELKHSSMGKSGLVLPSKIQQVAPKLVSKCLQLFAKQS